MPLFFFLFPVFGLFNGIKYFFKSHYRYGILFFAFWFGYSVFFYSGDVVAYRDDFAILVNYSWDDFIHVIINFNNETLKFVGIIPCTYNSKPDFFAFILGFLVSRFTENPRWFFAFVSVIYFYLMLRFLDEVPKFTGIVKSKGWKLFFVGLVIIVPFFVGVTGVRFWTALFLFAWMLMKYINTGSKKYLFCSAFSILFHYTFIFPVVVSLIATLIQINRKVFKILVIIGIVYVLLSSTTNSLDFIKNTLEFFDNDTVSKVSSSYLDEDGLAKKVVSSNDGNWYVNARVQFLNLFFLVFFIVDFFNFNRWKQVTRNIVFDNLYQLFFIVSLFTFNLGSLGRFIYIFYLLVLIRILQLQTLENRTLLKKWNYIFLPILLLHLFVSFRSGFYYIDPLLLIAPSISLLFIHSDISLSQFLVGH